MTTSKSHTTHPVANSSDTKSQTNDRCEYKTPVLEFIKIQSDTEGKASTIGAGETSSGGFVSTYGPS